MARFSTVPALLPAISARLSSFDGVDDRVVVADDPSLQLTKSMTIEGWVQVDSFPDAQQNHAPILFRGDDRGGLDPYVLTAKYDGSIAILA